MIFSIAALTVLITMVMAMIRALSGPTVFDRVLAVNMFGTKTVLLICLVGYVVDRPDFLDLAVIYALISFVGALTILKYFTRENAVTRANEDRSEEMK